MTDSEKLRLSEINFSLKNQDVVQVAYCIRELIEPLIENRSKLYFEQANCYQSCFYLLRGLLKKVDRSYLQQHENLVSFYQKDRDLDNSFDRLSWIEPTKGV